MLSIYHNFVNIFIGLRSLRGLGKIKFCTVLIYAVFIF